MPTQLEISVWEAVNKKDIQKVKQLIENNPQIDLHNIIDESTHYNLVIYLLTTITPHEPKSLKDLTYILTHKNMKWETVCSKKTAAEALFNVADLDQDFSVIEALSKTEGFICSNNSLSLSYPASRLKTVEKLHKLQLAKKPQVAEKITEAVQKVVRAQNTVSLSIDLTVMFAIENDRADLFALLVLADVNPLAKLGKFGKKQSPLALIEQFQPLPNINAWLIKNPGLIVADKQEEIKESPEEREQEFAAKLARLGQFKTTQIGIQLTHDAAAVNIKGENAESRDQRASAAVATFG